MGQPCAFNAVALLCCCTGSAADCGGNWHGTPSVCTQGGDRGAAVQAVRTLPRHAHFPNQQRLQKVAAWFTCRAGRLRVAAAVIMVCLVLQQAYLLQLAPGSSISPPLMSFVALHACREECGVDVILFSSCDEPQSIHSSSGSKRQRGTAAAAAAASAGSSLAGRSSAVGCSSSFPGSSHRKQHGPGVGLIAAVAAVAVAAVSAAAAGSLLSCYALLLVAALVLLFGAGFSSCRSRLQSLWYKPVRAYVQGGYTISPREDCNAMNSPECLVTCILKVKTGHTRLAHTCA